MNNNSKQGEELNQLSRLLFDRAARLWLSALVIEVIGGTTAIAVGLINFSPNFKLLFAFIVFLILAGSYILKIIFEFTYDDAETMRRQSVLTEAVDWPIGATQFSEWRQKAGNRILKYFKTKPRDKNYYATQKQQGARRLLEMTIESAFFTRHIYCYIKTWLWVLFSLLLIATIFIFTIAPLDGIQTQTRLQVIYILYLSLPIFISIDLLGWAIRLERLSNSIRQIEIDLERLENGTDPDIEQVLRLVSEYNCQVIGGFPIPSTLFYLWHDSINELWNQREKKGWK